MAIQALLKRNTYHDSITLMTVVQAIKKLPSIEDAGAVMATEMNLELLRDAHLFPATFLADQAAPPGPNDLLIVVRSSDEQQGQEALARAQEQLTSRSQDEGAEAASTVLPPRSLETALRREGQANLAVISVAGEHAWLEAEQALHRGLHVFLFSDNVSIEHEQRLKALALDNGLLLMGPDCGTAMLNGVGLGFSNVVPRGSIGMVGASGTGMQQIMCLLAKAGMGISQAIGVGGRDLSAAIGGVMTRYALQLLADDLQTEVIVLVSKPPAEAVAREILAMEITKPLVVVFLGSSSEPFPTLSRDIRFTRTLTEGARMAVEFAGGDRGRVPGRQSVEQDGARLATERSQLAPSQRYLRAFYAGGTLCDEAMIVLREHVGAIASNIPLQADWALASGKVYYGHTALDLGADEFTRGRPHPMIDPSLRLQYLERAAADPETAVLLFDIVLGFCADPNPAAVYAPAIQQLRKQASQEGRSLPVIISLCGTDGDPQGLGAQRAMLEAAGALVYESNEAVALAAASLVSQSNRIAPTENMRHG